MATAWLTDPWGTSIELDGSAGSISLTASSCLVSPVFPSIARTRTDLSVTICYQPLQIGVKTVDSTMAFFDTPETSRWARWLRE